jgi:hypothetical protein
MAGQLIYEIHGMWKHEFDEFVIESASDPKKANARGLDLVQTWTCRIADE